MEEEKSRARKRKVRLFAGLFIGLLIAFTLAGNTLQALSLPKVVTMQVRKDNFSYTFNASAMVIPKESRDLTNPASWTVDKVLVKEGDAVHKGQILVQYDSRDAMQDIVDQERSLEKYSMSMESMKYAIIQAMQGEDSIAKMNATTQFESAKLDLAGMQQRIQIQKKKLSDNEQIVAPFDGIVTEVGAVEGLNSAGGPDIRISNSTKGYQSELLIPSNIASVMSVGESLDSITLIGEANTKVPGKIAKIEEVPDSSGGSAMNVDDTTSGPMYRLMIAFEDKGLKGGERVQVRIMKEDPIEQILVPTKAVHKELDQAYVYKVYSTSSPLGNTNRIQKCSIKISNSNADVTAVSEGINENEEIVTDAYGLIMDGTRVRK